MIWEKVSKYLPFLLIWFVSMTLRELMLNKDRILYNTAMKTTVQCMNPKHDMQLCMDES